MIKRLFILAALFLMAVPAFAQVGDTVWVRRHNGPGNAFDGATDIVADAFGNVYVTGASSQLTDYPFNYNYATIKYDNDGNFLWGAGYDGSGNSNDLARAIAIDARGNVYITGRSPQNNEYPYNDDFVTIKYSSQGIPLWVERFEGPGGDYDDACAIAIDDAGNVYVTGTCPENGSWPYNEDYVTIKYDSLGNDLWVQAYDGQAHSTDCATAMTIDASGNIYVTGYSYQNPEYFYNEDYVTIRYDSDGNEIWIQSYNGAADSSDFAQAIAVDYDGNVYVAGNSRGSGVDNDYAVVKYGPAGNQIWVQRYNGPGSGYDNAAAVAVDATGNVYVTGDSYSATSAADIATIKYNSAGAQLWVQRYNGPGNDNDTGSDIKVDAAGNIYVTGTCTITNEPLNTDYVTIMYGPSGNQVWLKQYNGPANADDGSHNLALDGCNNVCVTGWSNGGASGSDYATIKYRGTPSDVSLQLFDGTAAHSPIPNRLFKFYNVQNNPPQMAEVLKGERNTDGEGKVILPNDWFGIGDMIKVERLMHTQAAVKHRSILPSAFRVKVDNADFDVATGAISYYRLTCDPEQSDTVGHSMISYDLLVSVEWEADQQYLDSLSSGTKFMSNYLYDVSDGQACLDSVRIFDNKVNWDSADIQICAGNEFIPHSHGIGGSGRNDGQIHFPRKWFGTRDDSRNGSFTENPLIFIDALDYRTKCHEFGHYGLSFYDEYFEDERNRCAAVANYGFMDDQYDNMEPYASEMSSALRYTDPACQNTRQWSNNHHLSCWDFYESMRERTIDGIFVPITGPDERTLVPGLNYFRGPNNNMAILNFDVGKRMWTSVTNADAGASSRVFINRDDGGVLITNANTILLKNARSLTINEGNTADNGRIRCLGVNSGDILRMWTRKGKRWLWVDYTVSLVDRGLGNTLLLEDSVEVISNEVKGDYQMNNQAEFETENSLRYNLGTNRTFSQNPTLDFYSPSGSIYNYTFSEVPNGYETAVNESLGQEGAFSINAIDDSMHSFFVHNPYEVTYFTTFPVNIYGSQGASELHLDTLNSSMQKLIILESDFPPLRDGLDSLAVQAGAAYSLASYPQVQDLSGSENDLIIRYSQSDLEGVSETSLRVFKWSDQSNRWNVIGGVVDTVKNEVYSPISSLGLYAVFSIESGPSGCDYLPGDANGSSSFNGLDVSYSVAYFKGGPPPPYSCNCPPHGTWYVAGDVNSSCSFNGLDVTYAVSYFKGGPGPQPCADCLPRRR